MILMWFGEEDVPAQNEHEIVIQDEFGVKLHGVIRELQTKQGLLLRKRQES